MRIALITAYDDNRRGGIKELETAIRRLGHIPCYFYVDRAGIRMNGNGVSVSMLDGKIPKRVRFDAGILRNIGVVKDYEQFGHRIWSVKALELEGTRVMNKIDSWVPASDKFATLVTLAKAGLPVPDTISSEDFFLGYEAAKRFHSVVIKPLRSGLGLGIFKLDDPDAAMHVFNAFTSLNKPIYVQEFLEKKNNGDYRVVVIGNEAIGAEFRRGRTWKTNIAQGGMPSKARLTGEMAELAIRATRAMKLDFAGIDIAETKDGYFILETNPSMAWAGFKEVTGVDPAERIVKHLIKAVKS